MALETMEEMILALEKERAIEVIGRVICLGIYIATVEIYA